ncbi:hypothetical protein H8959_001048 [Pygathrix nigripes]
MCPRYKPGRAYLKPQETRRSCWEWRILPPQPDPGHGRDWRGTARGGAGTHLPPPAPERPCCRRQGLQGLGRRCYLQHRVARHKNQVSSCGRRH